jgi:copper homeostasis protein CutC
MALLLEVIVQSVADARAAAEGGADRLEVVRAIRDGGLTPPLELVRAIAAEVSLPLRVMVRENAGYSTNGEELPALRLAIAGFAAEAVDGAVLGFAVEHEPAIRETVRVLEAAPAIKATFHRAFDDLCNPLEAIDRLAEIPQIDRILTSGGAGIPAERCGRLRRYTARANGRLIIVAGSAVDEEMLAFIARTGCVAEVHVGRAARADGNQESPVSAARVARLRELAGAR